MTSHPLSRRCSWLSFFNLLLSWSSPKGEKFYEKREERAAVLAVRVRVRVVAHVDQLVLSPAAHLPPLPRAYPGVRRRSDHLRGADGQPPRPEGHEQPHREAADQPRL